MTCDGSGRLPCKCSAAAWNKGVLAGDPRTAPCSCLRECDGCPECEAAKARAEAARAAEHRELSDWYHGKVGTAPPRAKGEPKGAARAKGDGQGRMF